VFFLNQILILTLAVCTAHSATDSSTKAALKMQSLAELEQRVETIDKTLKELSSGQPAQWIRKSGMDFKNDP
jgi:type II secretory pathway component PulJ